MHPTLLIQIENTVSRSNIMLHTQKGSFGWLVNCVTWSHTGFKPFINCLVSCHAIAGVYMSLSETYPHCCSCYLVPSHTAHKKWSRKINKYLSQHSRTVKSFFSTCLHHLIPAVHQLCCCCFSTACFSWGLKCKMVKMAVSVCWRPLVSWSVRNL